ncbi:MAG: MFS transporter [Geminicoccaceae bacterium]
MTPGALRQRITDAVVMATVAGMSFFLLLYVGFGEAQRSYQQIYVDKLVAQNRVMVNAIEGFLRRDLPLDQYVGFAPRAAKLRSSDGAIAAITVLDQKDRPLFVSGDGRIGLLNNADPKRKEDAGSQTIYEVRRDASYLQVTQPLRNRHDQVGRIAITMPHSLIGQQVKDAFSRLLPVAIGLPVMFALFVGLLSRWLARKKWPVVPLTYTGLFLVMSVLVVSTLVGLYTHGTQIKTKALADSLGQRMTEVVGFNLDIEQIPGLDRAFAEYRRLNPDISSAALLVDDEIRIHTDSFLIGQTWRGEPGTYEYIVDISPPTTDLRIEVAITLPQGIVYWQMIRSVKNFAALFIASAFLASVFLQLAGSLRSHNAQARRRQGTKGDPPPLSGLDEDHALKLVKPVFYVVMCVEHLSYAFLPQLTSAVIESSGLSGGLTSVVFAVYYLCFALTVVPSGHIAQRFSPRPLMIVGMLLSMISFGLLILEMELWLLIVARAAAGIGQAMLFIGVQSFILAVVSPQRKTQGAAIIVYGFQGGMISGMAIGSLLVSYIGAQGVFTIAFFSTAIMILYAFLAVPRAKAAKPAANKNLTGSLKDIGKDVIDAFSSPEMMKTIAFIGIPAKAVLTGVIVFALPLLMAAQGYRQEDIGQILMIYAAGVVLANGYISRLVDRTGDTRLVLVGGAILSAIGLGLIACMALDHLGMLPMGGTAEVITIILGVTLVGGAHGLINAPVVTHVANLELADRVGVSTLTATYRFMERIGHVAGPIVVGQLFLIGGENAIILTWIGGAVAVLGILFMLLAQRVRSEQRRKRLSDMIGRIDDVVGLHLDPPYFTLVLSLEDTGRKISSDVAQTAITQHLESKSHIIDEKLLSAIAAGDESIGLDLVEDGVVERRQTRQFVEFLNAIDRTVPTDKSLLVIVSGRKSTYRLIHINEWLEERPNSALVSMRSSQAWLDQLRGWLAVMTLDRRQGRDHTGLHQLQTAFRGHLRSESGPLKRFVWTASAPLAVPSQRPVIDLESPSPQALDNAPTPSKRKALVAD